MGYNRLPTVQEKRHDISFKEGIEFVSPITLPDFELETEHESSELDNMANRNRYREIVKVSTRFGIDGSEAAYAIDTLGPIRTLVEFAYLLSKTDSGDFRKAVDMASNADRMPQESRVYETLVAESEISGIDFVKVIDNYATKQHKANKTLTERALITQKIVYSTDETKEDVDPVSSNKSLKERPEDSIEGCSFTDEQLEDAVASGMSRQS